MLKEINNERGMTLVELVASLVLVILVSTLLFTTLSIGIKYNTIETKKRELQQEANYITTALLNIHRKSDEYYIKIEQDKLFVKTCKKDKQTSLMNCSMYEQVSSSSYYVKVDGVYGNEVKVIPQKNDFEFDLNLSDTENEKLTIEIETILARITNT